MYNRVTVIEQRFRQYLPERDNAYYFGFLPVPWSISCDSVSITPLPDYADMSRCLGSHVHSDGFLYPSAQRDLADPLTGDARLEIPRSERPGFMHFLPASHELQFGSTPMRDPHRGSGAFVVHLLGYLTGVRVEFHDWRVDGRARVVQDRPFWVTRETVVDFLAHALAAWERWAATEQQIFANLLYMHNRLPGYEWGWERFTVEYMVLDACWRIANARKRIVDEGHSRRIRVLCQEYGIPCDDTVAVAVVKLRNGLFHEALWDQQEPCNAIGTDVDELEQSLRNLNERLIPALLGYKNAYVMSEWWDRNVSAFEPPPRSAPGETA